ncbi:MAG: hypothetical protein RQ968_00835 [Thermoproteota archaeon]|jgi:ssDNA-binding Zn-finger/Zn-ribbon topoisomerase 1|nr:hypothetical protein [Thermoproteota archaeon]
MSREIIEIIEESLKVKTKTLLECEKCKEKVERDHKEGDYVNKLTDEKCPKCSNIMYIKLIYAIQPVVQKQSLF